jgi:hypothetical protein
MMYISRFTELLNQELIVTLIVKEANLWLVCGKSIRLRSRVLKWNVAETCHDWLTQIWEDVQAHALYDCDRILPRHELREFRTARRC